MYFTDQNIMQQGDLLEMNNDGFQMKKLNIAIELKRILKMGSINLVIMLTARVMVIKMTKTALFYFLLIDSKNLVTVWLKYLSTPERSYCVLLENGSQILRFWSDCS